ncbi:MAG: hypothetical protein PHG85_00900 [Candidatus Altiarchaeota archaeon]|nr:hypothetical protein [Candidatus Altiarchaeota archaeon]
MTQVYIIEGGRMRQVEPQKVAYAESARVSLPLPKSIELSSGKKLQPEAVLRLEAARQKDLKLAVLAQDMSVKHAEAYGFLKSELAGGRPETAELMLRIYERDPGEIDRAAIALHPELKPDHAKMSQLAGKLRRGEPVEDMAKELDDMIPIPERPKIVPRPEPKTERPPIPRPADRPPIPEPHRRPIASAVVPGTPPSEAKPSVSLTEAQYIDQNHIEENIRRDFPPALRDSAIGAYKAFWGGGGRLTVVQSRSLFHILGDLRGRYEKPEWMLLYFQHALSEPKDAEGRIGMMTDSTRFGNATDLMGSVLMFNRLGRDVIKSEAGEAAFRAIFLSGVHEYEFMTGNDTASLARAVRSVSRNMAGTPFDVEEGRREYRNVYDNLLFLTHLASTPDCREIGMDDARITRGNRAFDNLLEFAIDNGMEETSALKRSLFARIFIRDRSALELTTSEDARNATIWLTGKRMADIARLEPEFSEKYLRLILGRPEILPNIERTGGTANAGFAAIPSAINSIMAIQDLPDRRGTAGRILDRMLDDEETALRLSEPGRLHLALELVNTWAYYVKPADLLDVNFLMMADAAQQSSLEVVKRLKDDPHLVERRKSPDAGPAESKSVTGGKPEEHEPRASLTTYVHDIRIPADLSYPGEDPMFSTLNAQYLLRAELGRINRLPAHQRRIVNYLSNLSSPDEDFQIGRDNLLDKLRGHRNLARLYLGGEGMQNLDRDLAALGSGTDKVVDYPKAGGAVRLADAVRKTGGTVELQPQDEAEATAQLVGILDETRYGPRREKEFKTDLAIVIALARSQNYVAERKTLVRAVHTGLAGENVSEDRISARISHLITDRDIIRRTDPTGTTVMMSPNVISQVDRMRLPEVYRTTYMDATDPLRRMRRMYEMTISDDRPPNRHFSPDLTAGRVDDIYRAVATLTTGGDAMEEPRMADAIERRLAVVMTLSNMGLSLEYGAKRQSIIEETGMGESTVQGLLTDMVRSEMVERVSQGYYRISPDYRHTQQPDLAGQTHAPSRPGAMHENINEAKVQLDIAASGRLKTATRKAQATAIMAYLSDSHMTLPHCARANDVLELNRTFGGKNTEGQNNGDLEALMAETSAKYGPVVERLKIAGRDVFYRITDRYAGGAAGETQ